MRLAGTALFLVVVLRGLVGASAFFAVVAIVVSSTELGADVRAIFRQNTKHSLPFKA
jgi:hypothetical protein